MEFTFETEYNAKNMAVMAKGLRKTARRKRSRRTRVFGTVVMALGALLLAVGGFAFDFRTVVTLTAVALVAVVMLFEDRLNGYVAARNLLPGTERAETVFSADGYRTTTGAAKSEFGYDRIEGIAESENFFVFALNGTYAQLYDKRTLRGGTAEDFRRFISEKTGKTVCRI